MGSLQRLEFRKKPTLIGLARFFCIGASRTALIAACIAPFVIPATTHAEIVTRPDLGYCANDIRQGWHFYCDPDAQAPEEEDAPKPVAAPAPQTPPKAPEPTKKKTATERMKEFSARIDELKHMAILEPTPDNLHNYMMAQAVAMRMASTFADQWQRVLFKTPELDANVRNPTSNLGGHIFQDIRTQEEEDALIEAASSKGLMFVFEGEEGCAVCELQSRIIGTMAETYGVRVLPVSVDGSVTEHFPNPMVDNGQLERFGLDKFPRPNVSLVDPATDEVIIIGSGLMTQDVLLKRIHMLTTTEPGQSYANEGFLRDHAGYAPGALPREAVAPVLPENPLTQLLGAQGENP